MNNENKDKLIRSSLDEPTKQAIKQAWNIDVDSEILSPLVDYIFKRIFTADETNSKKALIDFINSVLEHEEDDKIVDLTIVSAQIPVDRGTEKKSIFDIRAKYNNGRQAVIEMQKEATPGFKKRSQHIISRTYGSQEISGEDYDKLEKCYVICITNFNVIKKTTDYIKDYRFRDRQGNDLTDDETIIFLDLSKIEKVLTKPVNEITNVEKWAVFFKYVGDESKRDVLNKILEGAEGIQMATNILLTVSKDEEARAQYESELRFQLDQSSRMAGAKKEGRKEAQIEMAKKMLKRGISIEDVLEDSGLTIEELED